ncbi:MAG TPA: protein kinase [Pirellulaceae bacterium]|nr:protein kinase [Pirellulaceae bacterium]
MSDKELTDSAIFKAAIHLPAEQRAAFLDRACGDNSELRSEVESLLVAHEQECFFLNLESATVTIEPEPEPTERPGVIVAGKYKLREQIGEGGMGTVWVADQLEPVRRRVALKLIKPGMDTRQVLARFEAERQALALMDHPNIAKVLDGGMTGHARPYFVMEYVKGVPITAYCDQARLSIPERLKLFVQVCQAVQHAHQKGIIHRDLKPSNILVCMYDGQAIPKVIDFGLAKAISQPLTEHTLYTVHGMMVGTPLYMSPEQAESNNIDIDTRSDVYSLGVILYELLTGSTPLERKRFKDAAFQEILRLIKEEEPSKPSTKLSSSENLASVAAQRGVEPAQLGRIVRGDLDWIVMKALEKERSRRYATANGLAGDVENFLRNEPVAATPPSRAYRLRKLIQRNRAAVMSAISIAVALVAGTVIATWQAVRATQARAAEAVQRRAAEDSATKAIESAIAEKQAKESALKDRQEANTARDQMAASLERERLTSYVNRIALAHREWLAGDVGRAQQLLEDCPPDLRNWEWRYLLRLCHSERVIFRGHADAVNNVAFSPDSSRVASTSWRQIKVWDSATGSELFTIPASAGGGVAFSPDGNRLVTSGFQTVTIWDAHSGKKETEIRAHEFLVKDAVFSPDGEKLATSSGSLPGAGRREGGEVKVWDAKTGKELFHFADLSHWANGLAFSPDGKYLAAGIGSLYAIAPAQPGEVRVWDVSSGNLVLTLTGHTFWVTDVAFSSDSKHLASASADQTVRVWEIPEGREVLTLRGHTGWVRSVAFSPDGQTLASAGDDQVVRVWNTATGRETKTFRGHTQGVLAVAFSPNGELLASTGGGPGNAGEVRIWDAALNQAARTFLGHTAPVTSVAFSPDSKLLVSASNGMSSITPGEAIVRQVASGQTRSVLHPSMMGFSAVAFSPDGTSVATGGDEGVKLWNHTTGDMIRLFRVRVFPMDGLAFSADGERIAAVGSDGLKIWETATARVLHEFQPHTIHVHDVAFSPDGRRFATTSWGGYLARQVDGVERTELLPAEVKVWDAESGKELMRMAGGGLGLAFSQDGKQIASGSQEGTVTIWDSSSGKVLCTLRGHARAVVSLAFTRDGRRLATASADQSVRIWETRYGQEVLVLRGQDEPIASVAFSPDGRYLASASAVNGEPGKVLVWDAGSTP